MAENDTRMNSQATPQRFRTVLWNRHSFCMRSLSDQQIHCVIAFNGHIDENRMARAARLTLDTEPVLGSRFVERWWRPYWEKLNDLDHMKFWHMQEGEDPRQATMSFITRPMEPLEGPQVHLLLIRSETDTLVVKMNHMAADVGGTKEYAYLLASIYRRLSEDPAYSPNPNTGGKSSLTQISKRLTLAQKFKILRLYRSEQAQGRRARPWGHWEFPPAEGTASPYTVAIRRIGPERFGAIKKYGQDHEATVNDVVIAAFCRAVCGLLNPPPGVQLRLPTTVDLRRYLPSGRGEAICNLVGTAFVDIIRDSGATLDDTVHSVRDQMNAKKANYVGLPYLAVLALGTKGRPFRIMCNQYRLSHDRAIKKREIEPFFTNLGVIDGEQLVFGGVKVTDAYLLAPIYYPPRFAIAVCGFGESLTLSFGVCQEAITLSAVEDFLDRLEEELPK